MGVFKCLIWTVIPTHYQSSFYKALRGAGVDLKVSYYEKVHAYRVEMGWHGFEELPEGEQYVPKSLEALDLVSDWRERINVIPGYGNKFLRDLVKELCRRGVKWVHWSEPSHPGLRWWRSYPVKCWYAKMVNTYALGVFGIGIRALHDFRKWGISAERVAFLPYATAGGDRYVQPDSICETFCGGRKAFVFLGSLIHRKGIDILLRAFAEIATISKEWVLLLVGDDRSKGAYQRLARKLGVAERVCFRGSVSAWFIPSVLRAAQVLVLPSRSDGWGVVLNEASSMGLALIGSENAGSSFHLIEPGENGFIVRAGSISSLARAMTSYVSDSELASRHGEHSLKVFEDFTPERNARRFIHAIQSWRAMDSKV